MGTSGYYVIRYKSTYYAWYNKHDSDIDALGIKVVADWLSLTPEDIEEIKKNLKTIEDREPELIDDDNFNGYKYAASTVRPEHVQMHEPSLELYIEFVYIVDLDKNKFKVKYYDDDDEVSNSRCRLDKLSKEFIEELLED
jgi:hypothetical protein